MSSSDSVERSRIKDETASSAGQRRVRDLPSAAVSGHAILSGLGGRIPALFLDYDGTLAPIAERPQEAVLAHTSRGALARLVGELPMAVVSGRDLDDLRSMVGLAEVAYAGSHGFDILTPDGRSERPATEFLPALDAVEGELRSAAAGIPGAWVDRKRYAVAVHYRQVERSLVPELDRVVAEASGRHPELRRTGGKGVFELLPGMEWDKGKAVGFLLEVLGLDRPDVVPFYIGDDETDEAAFQAVRGRGIGIVVARADEERLTAADYSLGDPGEVFAFLDRLGS